MKVECPRCHRVWQAREGTVDVDCNCHLYCEDGDTPTDCSVRVINRAAVDLRSFDFVADFEEGDWSEFDATNEPADSDIDVQTTTVKDDTYAGMTQNVTGASNVNPYCEKQYTAPAANTLYIGFWYLLHADDGNNVFGTTSNRLQGFLEVVGTGANNLMHPALTRDAGGHKWRINSFYAPVGGAEDHYEDDGPNFTFQFDTWYWIEYGYTISDTVGFQTLWVNGNVEVGLGPIDTNTSRGQPTKVRLGHPFGTGGNLYPFTVYIDNVVMHSGPIVRSYLTPDAFDRAHGPLSLGWPTGLRTGLTLPETGDKALDLVRYCETHEKYIYKVPLSIPCDWSRWYQRRAPARLRAHHGKL